MMIRSALPILGAFIFLCHSCSTPPTHSPATPIQNEIAAEFEEFIQGLSNEGIIPGGVVLMARNGTIVAEVAAGYQDIAQKDPMTKDTIFRLYSMSKPITSVAIMMLCEEDVLSLDMPVEKWLPEFADIRVYVSGGIENLHSVPANRSITIRDLLTHHAGLTYHFAGNTPVHKYYRKFGVMRDTPVGRKADDGAPARSLDELMERLAAAPLLYQPGEKFAYSYSTTVLGAIIEKATGQRLDHFLTKRIFEPLGMESTSFFISDDDIERFATNYVMTKDGLRVIESPETSDYRDLDRLLDGGGALAGTAEDYMRFALMLANGGELNGVRLLSNDAIAQMFHPHARVTLGETAFDFGYGFRLGDSTSETLSQLPDGAFGWSGSATTFFWVYSNSGDAIVFMTQVIFPPDTLALRSRIRRGVLNISERNRAY